MGDTTYRVYPYRWAVLGSFMLVNLMIQALWIDFSPIMRDATSYYGVSESAIVLLGELFMIIYLPMSIPVSWAIDRFGFRKATGFGAILMAIFALVRALAGPGFVLVIIGTVGLSIAQPFLMNAWTKVAAHWFAEGERATAVGLVTLSTLLGIAVGMRASPALAKVMSIGTMQYVYAAAAIIATLAYVVIARENPPSPAGPVGSGEKALMLDGLKNALSVPSFRLFLIVSFIGMGLFNGLMLLIGDIVGPRGFDPSKVGTLGDILLVGGIFGAVAIPAISDRMGKRRLWMLVGILGSLPGLAGMAIAHSFLLIAVSSFFLGFFLTSVMPVGMQFATEVTFPTPEGTTNGLVQLCGQFSVVFVFLMQAMRGKSGSFTMSLVASGVFVLGAACLVPFMKEAGGTKPLVATDKA
ncbi:MAG: MFS transporter [Rectinemataceae bacterium]